jgi:DNA-binding NarL/FixJ family response regulator
MIMGTNHSIIRENQLIENNQNVNARGLTGREKEILLLVSKGLTNRQIAENLFIAENTVKNHMKNLLEKLGLENRVQLASYAVKYIPQ